MGQTSTVSQTFHQAVRHPWPIFTIALALTVGGFWPSFFSKLSEAPLPHHVHGWSATAWMLLPVLQYGLIRRGQRRLHRLVGYASLVLAGTVAVSGVYVVRMMAFTSITSFRLESVKFVWQWRSGRVRWPIPILLAYYLPVHVTLTPLAASEGFQQFSNWFALVGRAGS